MIENLNCYFIYNKVTGDLRSLATVDPSDNLQPSEECVKATGEYVELFQNFITSKKKFTNYKIDINSSALKIIDKFAIELNSEYNSFYQVPVIKINSVNLFEIVLKIISIDDIPHLMFKYNGSRESLLNKKESSVTFYATKKDDINVLYETFKFNFEELNENNELIKKINQIDIDLLFKTNFSFYTRKIFKTYGCAVE
jgi:hypothetical protein